jgi:hypothetical protein
MAETDGSRTDRVNIPEIDMPTYKALIEEGDIEDAPFRSLKDVFMTAACYGYANDLRKPLPGGTKNTIRKEVLTQTDIAILKAIAIAAQGEIQALSRPGEILTVAEEYAHGSIGEVHRRLTSGSYRSLLSLSGLLSSDPS